jgi:GNAT superfamily N-acetyltransferase
MLDIELLPASAGNDAALVTETTALINRVYAEAEVGLWVDGATRTSATELAEQIRAGQIAVARMDGQIVGSVRIRRLATGEGEFAALASAPERRGLRIGRELVAFAERECRRHGATVMQLEVLVRVRGRTRPRSSSPSGTPALAIERSESAPPMRAIPTWLPCSRLPATSSSTTKTSTAAGRSSS